MEMKIMENSDIRLDRLKGATVINEYGEEFVIIDLYVRFKKTPEVWFRAAFVKDEGQKTSWRLSVLKKNTIIKFKD